jgi:NifU-like protein
MWEYTDKVKELYTNPKNVGKIEDADVVVEVGSIVCGDALKLYLKIDGDRIVDAKFETFGCGSAIASSSALTEMIKGKTIEEASKITNQDIVAYLGGLPEEKMHCSVMGNEALIKAIKKWKGEKVEDEVEEEKQIICQCFGVTDTLIRKVIRENKLTTVQQVTNYTKAGGACGSCIPKIEDILNEELGRLREATAEEAKKKPMTNLKRMQLVEEAIATVIRPTLLKDGGDIELIDIEGRNVIVALRGSCSNCIAANFTIKNFVEAKLKELVDESITVTEVKQ